MTLRLTKMSWFFHNRIVKSGVWFLFWRAVLIITKHQQLTFRNRDKSATRRTRKHTTKREATLGISKAVSRHWGRIACHGNELKGQQWTGYKSMLIYLNEIRATLSWLSKEDVKTASCEWTNPQQQWLITDNIPLLRYKQYGASSTRAGFGSLALYSLTIMLLGTLKR